MKKYFLLLILFFSSFSLFSREIKELSYFTLTGVQELREEQGFDKIIVYKTLNHEGGLKIRVLEIGNKDTKDNKNGVWLKILTTAPIWVDNGEWILKHSKFWIFLTDDEKIYEYEEI